MLIISQLLSAWWKLKRPIRGINVSTTICLLKNISKIKNDASKNGFVKNWAHIEKDEPLWLILVNNLGSVQT